VTEQPERKPRVSLSEIVTMLLSKGGTEHSSVTLSRNAKGETQIEVVARTGGENGPTTLIEAEEVCVAVYDRIRRRYPLSSGLTTKT
jgi:hypothetical protein